MGFRRILDERSWPMTAKQADDRKHEIAAYLRELADKIDNDEIDFLDGEVITITRHTAAPVNYDD